MSEKSGKIIINEEIYLSPLVMEDADNIVKHLQAKEIYMRTIMIPFPYQKKDAEWFIGFSIEKDKVYGHTMDWAIRKNNGELIGVIGYHGRYGKGSHKDEIGYWIAKDYWGKGIMSGALQKVCEKGQNEYDLVRIEAPIFAFNIHSQKVAEKCGFVLEGTMRKAYLKEGAFFDSKFYALVK